jgi:hypothetical protein
MIAQVAALALLLLMLPLTAWAQPCTPGTNCYCDKVKPGGALADSALLMCEDWEAPTLRSSTGVGNGPPYYGPWFDATGGIGPCPQGISGQSGDRGANSYWYKTYGAGVGGTIWPDGSPPGTPAFGCRCNVTVVNPQYTSCNGLIVWDAANRWDGNFGGALAFPSQPSDFNAEVSTLTAPTGTSTGTPGVFAGSASMAVRIRGANGATNGITGGKSFGNQRQVGVTQVMAFASNINTSNIWVQPWKFNEWDNDNSSSDGLFIFHNDFARSNQDPFKQFMFWRKTPDGLSYVETPASCAAHVAAATITVGQLFCNPDTAVYYRAGGNYNRSVDWPDGTWGCIQGHFENAGLINMRVRIWFTPSTGPHANTQMLIVDFSNFDSRNYALVNGISRISFDNYANANNNATPLTETTFRYEDNLHVRAGAPVSCAQIGFGGTGPQQPPPPTNFKLTIATIPLGVKLVGTELVRTAR